METQLELFTDKIAAKKKEFLSKHISKRAKFQMNVAKKRPKNIMKSTNDMVYINQLIQAITPDTQILLMSNAFDSPSIIWTIKQREKIKEVIVATWAITDRGLSMFNELGDDVEVYLLLDKTYSYKWVFESGAIAYLKNVRLKFSENHSKVILIKTDENFYSFVGSMNLSNNPRIENIQINNNRETYEFYEQFIKSEFE